MTRQLGRLGRIVLGAAIAGALGFGATQAVAAPAPRAETNEAGRCTDHDLCDNHCAFNLGYTAGKCINWKCHCFVAPGQWVPVEF